MEHNTYTIKHNSIIVLRTLQCILHLAHCGHLVIVQMKCKLRESYWWPATNAEVEGYIRHCFGCQALSKTDDKVDTIHTQCSLD